MGTAVRKLRLFLIRHGETVDNVAGVYAGSRDSELTNHGFQQATRLGLHFKSTGSCFTHIFSSQLQRAVKTAGLIRQAQIVPAQDTDRVPDVVQVPDIMEQDFGYYEGKRFYERAADSKLSGKDNHRQQYKDAPGFQDVESKEAMARRADKFLDEHLLPLLEVWNDTGEALVAVVSHGIILSTLWKRLLLRLPQKSVTLSHEVMAHARGITLEHLGGWSNTGYLELCMQKIETSEQSNLSLSGSSPVSQHATVQTRKGQSTLSGTQDILVAEPGATNAMVEARAGTVPEVEALMAGSSMPSIKRGWQTTIVAVNGQTHLKGLKRTRGGVGSSRHDTTQRNIDSFFKRRKVE